MKSILKKVFLALLIVFVIIQFFRPAKNISQGPFSKDIATKYVIPPDVQNTIKTSCYDCHSNNTSYPWYNNFQPVAWWLNSHVNDGKRGLNFNEFASYPIGKQYKRLQQIVDEIKDDGMPLSSYTLIHKNAIISADQKQAITNWVNITRDSFKAHYPEDSLKKPQQKPTN